MWQNVRELLLRVVGVFRTKAREQELNDELEFHLAQKRAQHETSGATTLAARDQARREFGGVERWKERCRDTVSVRPIEDLGRDLRLAVRMLRKSPVFTVVAVATLAAAIGANTTIFSLMNAIMLRAVDVPDASRLALLRVRPGEYGYSFNYPWFRRTEKESAGLMQTFAFTGRSLLFEAEKIQGQLVSGSYFPTLRVNAARGRYITTNDDKPGTPEGQVAVISGAFWRSRLGADPKVIGRKIKLNQAIFTVVGVMPDSFRGMDRDQRPSVFIPLETEPVIDAPFNNIAAGYQFWWLRIGARMHSGVSLKQVDAYLRAHSRTLTHGKEMPPGFQFNGHKLDDLYMEAEPGFGGYSYIRQRFAKPLTVLMGLVGLVLLVACLNLATLLIARASARRREIVTRFALGASRLRLIRQLLTECLLLSFGGTVIGLPVALLLTRALAALIAPQHGPGSAQLDIAPDPSVFAFTAAVAVLATLATGIAPAFRSTAKSFQTGLRESSATFRAAERGRFWPRILLASEIAAALVLVAGAGLLSHSFFKLNGLAMGFDPHGVINLTIETKDAGFLTSALPERYRQTTERLKTLPFVSGASIAQIVPFSGYVSQGAISVPGKGAQPLWENAVGPDYFRTMHTRLREGREFRWSDTGPAGNVAILNASAAKALFPDQRALGQHVVGRDKAQLEIIAVVDDAKYESIREAAPPAIYFSATSWMDGKSPALTFALRTTGPPASVVTAAAKVIQKSMPGIPAPVAITMEDTLNESLASERMMTMLAAFFGILALAITGIGLYGTLAYVTERRTGEIGIRIALGARPQNIISLVCAENGAVALAGCTIGLVTSFMASKFVASFLFGVTPHDPAAFALAVAALIGVAVAASLLPAWKATRVDPVAAIRHE